MKYKEYYKNRIVLITGAAGGIGKEIAKQLHCMGARVICTDIDEAALLKTTNELSREGRWPIGIKTDVSDSKSIERARQELKGAGILPDMIFCNAGIATGGYEENITDEIFLKTIDVNLMGVVNTVRVFLNDILDKEDAHLIAVSSFGGIAGMAGLGPYCTTKFGVNGFFESLYGELKHRNVSVSIICPYPLETGIVNSVEFGFPLEPEIPDGRREEALDKAKRIYWKSFSRAAMPLDIAVEKHLKGVAAKKLYISERKAFRAMLIIKGMCPRFYMFIISFMGKLHLALIDKCTDEYFGSR